jgi:hypothetical protein
MPPPMPDIVQDNLCPFCPNHREGENNYKMCYCMDCADLTILPVKKELDTNFVC